MTDRPITPHKFTAMNLTPNSCVVCGQPRKHSNHRTANRINSRQLLRRVLKRPDWKIYELEGQDQGSELYPVPTVPERAARLLDGVRETIRERNDNRRGSRRKGR